MKYFSALFSVIGIAILMLELVIFNNQWNLYQRDFDTTRLSCAIDYAEESAFAKSLQTGDLSSDYTDIMRVTSDPTYVMDEFANVMCANYDMAMVEENRQRIMNSVDAACLVNNDGYYIALLSEVKQAGPDDDEDLGNIEYKFKWSPKLPFTYEMEKGGIYGNPLHAAIGFDLHNADVNIYDYDENRVYYSKGNIEKEVYYEDVTVNGGTFQVQRTRENGVYGYLKDGAAATFPQNCVSDNLKYRVANNIIANALNYNISVVSEKRGGASYNVHLPARTTADGVSSVIGNSLIVVISDADYAGKAHLTEAVIGGHRVTNKAYIIAFEQDGIKYYCKQGQLPMDNDGSIPMKNGRPLYTVEGKYLTEYQAALDGYHPHLTYLQIPIKRK